MQKNEVKKVIERYNKRLKKFGVKPKTLGWDKERHFLRYHILLSQWTFNNNSLLDFGCGFGDMYNYIQENKLNIIYNGYDINNDLIKEGIKKYQKIKLKSVDFLNSKDYYFDFIVSSGVHNFKIKDNWEFIEKTFEKFNRCAKKGFAINFISNKVQKEFKKEHLYYTSPSKILELAYQFSNKVILRNDYMPFEFTIFIDLENDYDKRKIIYPKFKKI